MIEQSPDDAQVALAGGEVTAEVVRVGDTVRRTTGRWTPAVQALLRHLEAKGFDGAPRVLGFDDRGREILTFIEGTPGTHPWPVGLRTDEGLAAAVRLVAAFHDAVADFVAPKGAEWVDGPASPGPGQIVCHRDMGPENIIWRRGEPVAIIDWDFAGPGNPLDDLSYLAFHAVPMRDDDHCRDYGFTEVTDRAHRLRLVCDTYGRGATPPDLVARAQRHWENDIEEIEAFGPQGLTPWAGFLEQNLHHTIRELLAWLLENRGVLIGPG